MGNVETHDLSPVREHERKELNLSRRVNYKQYCRHMNGESCETSLIELPWSIVDSISLYERMDVSFNEIYELPTELPLRLPHLQHINLNHNRLSELPESFGLLFHLRVVLVSHNNLRSLPKSFTRLVKLEKIDVSHNKLKELPEDIGDMEVLAKINVSHNRLRTLPESLGQSETVHIVLAGHNKLTYPPQSICDEGSEATVKYLKKYATKKEPKVNLDKNVFKRVRGNQLHSSVPNPQSAQAQYIQSQTHTTNTPSRIKTPLLPPLDASALDPLDLRDRITGLLYGAAIGDAIGLATEFMPVQEAQFYYEPETLTYSDIVRDQHRVRWRQGDWTVDFDQCALVLDSLDQWGGVVDELDFAKRLKHWSDHGFTELGDSEGIVFSNTITKVVNTPYFTEKPHIAARSLVEQSHDQTCDQSHDQCDGENCNGDVDILCDNAALSRCLVLGVPHFHDYQEVVANTLRICKATHSEPRCLAAAVMVAATVALLLQGKHDVAKPEELEKMIAMAAELARRQLTTEKQYKEFDHIISVTQFDSLDLTSPSTMSFVYTPLAAGLAALRDQRDYREIITDLIMRGGDSNSNACIAGGFLGCRVGYSQLPTPWITGLRNRQAEWLNAKINTLLDMMGIP
ncbi:uncharacterized protein LOC106163399 [Lingula anatina]|uniref:Uncharacterized protein LOC106163399 n=1 Tax=Lingula anatina TaxID=7574 RepID=A0A1S3IDU1_LINAN|nr:uncharacterized protein LOC106163399 [Lingula anatina]|eukprot:XP_013396425.1 uncharacterized protein LOC106163399 [Lingula anatina]